MYKRSLAKNGYKIEPFDLYMRLILLFPIFTTVQDNGLFNKILFFLVLAVQLFILTTVSIKTKSVLHILIMASMYVFTLLHTVFPMPNFNLLIYYPFLVLFVLFVIDNKQRIINWLKNNRNYIRWTIKLWSLITGVTAFVPACYYVKEGGSLYFGSIVGTIFRLGPAALFIQSLILISMSMYNKKKDFFFMIVPMYCFFMGSSRTYLLVGLSLFVISWYWFVVSKRNFLLTIIPIIIISVFLVINSSIGDKISYTLDETQYGDFWFRVTSSRSQFWGDGIIKWSREPILNKLFGCGLDYSGRVVGMTWAHNDFLEILYSFGIVGVLQYTVLMITLIKRLIIGIKVPMFIILCVAFTWLFNAFFNMFYVYFCAMICYPIALFAIRYYYTERKSDSAVKLCAPEQSYR